MTEMEAHIMPILDELLQMPPDMTGLVENDAILRVKYEKIMDTIKKCYPKPGKGTSPDPKLLKPVKPKADNETGSDKVFSIYSQRSHAFS